MGVMTSHAVIPTGRPFTVADLEAMPDDGNRYELIDGVLIVSPAPAPLMVGEVLSRSTALHDRNTKRAHYERMGVQTYWLLDPDEPGALTVFDLDGDGRYEHVAHVVGDEAHEARVPFPVTVVPARLLDGLRP